MFSIILALLGMASKDSPLWHNLGWLQECSSSGGDPEQWSRTRMWELFENLNSPSICISIFNSSHLADVGALENVALPPNYVQSCLVLPFKDSMWSLWVLKMARPAPDIISRPLFTGRMFFIKKTGLSWITFMWEKLLCLPWAGANKFFLETHFAVNEVGSTSKEELNLLLWLLR